MSDKDKLESNVSPVLSQEELEKFAPATEELAEQPIRDEEKRELTDEKKREIFIQALKQSKIKFRPIKNGIKTTETSVPRKFGGNRIERTQTVLTNITVHQFGTDYRKSRKRKNKMQRASRKANRK